MLAESVACATKASPAAALSGRVAALLECVENEVEAVLERRCEAVADVGDVPGDVGKLLRERGRVLLLWLLGELADLLLRDRCALVGAVEGQALVTP